MPGVQGLVYKRVLLVRMRDLSMQENMEPQRNFHAILN